MDEINQAATAAEIAAYLEKAARAIRFGSIEIVIHDSRIVQIERREKLRIDAVQHSKHKGQA